MKQYHPLLMLIAICSFLTSCGVVTGIFKAGMSFGIFIVVAIVVGIIFLFLRANRKR